ncbi:MAG: hypothetical protein O2960_16310 [Verrucomicrobia bacterium]|nr:hypothetical protein [Verrucomicrobiota bacterium]
MKTIRFLFLSAFIALALFPNSAQEADPVGQLKKQLEQIQANFEKIQQQQKLEIERLTRQIQALQEQNDADAETKRLESELAAEMATAPAAGSQVARPSTWSPSQPIPVIRAGSAYMNIGFDVLTVAGWSTDRDVSQALNLGDHDPIQRGFSLRNAEITLEGAVDPYFKGFASPVFKLDPSGETEFELEEAYLMSSSLPANLQIKAGQFFAAFGRQNSIHPHAWNFVDQPLILNRAFGPEGLRNPGGQISWLAPTPFYTEVFLGVFNGGGGTAFSFRNAGDEGQVPPSFYGRETLGRGLRGPGDLLFVPRIASSFDLTDTQTIVVGASGAIGPNDTGLHSRSEVFGLDAYWKWKPLNAMRSLHFLSWQTELLYRRFGAGEDLVAGFDSENMRDWGFYSEVLWGFRPRWMTGLRGEFVTGNNSAIDAESVFRGDRSRVSPNLTWLPSEYSKLRLQYNHDRGQNIGVEHSVWLQLEISLGAHAAHKF